MEFMLCKIIVMTRCAYSVLQHWGRYNIYLKLVYRVIYKYLSYKADTNKHTHTHTHIPHKYTHTLSCTAHTFELWNSKRYHPEVTQSQKKTHGIHSLISGY